MKAKDFLWCVQRPLTPLTEGAPWLVPCASHRLIYPAFGRKLWQMTTVCKSV